MSLPAISPETIPEIPFQVNERGKQRRKEMGEGVGRRGGEVMGGGGKERGLGYWRGLKGEEVGIWEGVGMGM